MNSTGQASSSGVSSGPPGSNHVGSLNHARPAIIRRSHDSGFDMISSSNNTREQQSPLKSVPSAMDMHVRWIQDPTTTTTIGGLGANNPHDPLDHLINPATLGGDELMHLLDLIQAKSEKLKSEVDPQQKRGLQAINEDSSPIGNYYINIFSTGAPIETYRLIVPNRRLGHEVNLRECVKPG